MQLGYVILYVDDVRRALDFYGAAFGFETHFLDPEHGDFGQLQTGETSLSFCSHRLAQKSVPGTYAPVERHNNPPGLEISITADDVDAAFGRAVNAGAEPASAPHDEPWGQRVAYVRDVFGLLVGIVSPMPELDGDEN